MKTPDHQIDRIHAEALYRQIKQHETQHQRTLQAFNSILNARGQMANALLQAAPDINAALQEVMEREVNRANAQLKKLQRALKRVQEKSNEEARQALSEHRFRIKRRILEVLKKQGRVMIERLVVESCKK